MNNNDCKGYLLHDGGQVDGGSGPDALGVAAVLEKAVDATDWVLKSSARRLRLRDCAFSFATSGHLEKVG